MRSRGWVRGATMFITLLFFTAMGGPSSAKLAISMSTALGRQNKKVVSGTLTRQWKSCATSDETFDLRKLASKGNFTDSSNLSIGDRCGAPRTVVVGGTVVGSLSHSLDWSYVKKHYDASGLRLEGRGWMVVYDLSVTDIEDGFRPRVADGTENNNTVAWQLSGAYMNWIRDDAIEDDYLMSGLIQDTLIDGTNRFISAYPRAGTHYSNQGMTVTVNNVLVHMKSMKNSHDKDGFGFGGIFKWSDKAGSVNMSDSIFLLDEAPTYKTPFPKGNYSNVTLVLGPNFDGPYPTALPKGVHTTRDMSVWKDARSTWLNTH